MDQFLVLQLFTDFKKAYDSVKREVFCKMLTEYDICMKLILIIKRLKYVKMKHKVLRMLTIDNLLREEKNIYIYI